MTVQEQCLSAFGSGHQSCSVLIDGQNDGENTEMTARQHAVCFDRRHIDGDLKVAVVVVGCDKAPIEATQHQHFVAA